MKYDCPVYCNSPAYMPHALAAAEDIDFLAEYLQWAR